MSSKLIPLFVIIYARIIFTSADSLSTHPLPIFPRLNAGISLKVLTFHFFQTMFTFLIMFLMAMGSSPSKNDCFKNSKCVPFKTYINFDNRRVEQVLQMIENTCVLEWFADSSAIFLNRVYDQDGVDATLELSKALQRVWSR